MRKTTQSKLDAYAIFALGVICFLCVLLKHDTLRTEVALIITVIGAGAVAEFSARVYGMQSLKRSMMLGEFNKLRPQAIPNRQKNTTVQPQHRLNRY